MDHTTTRILIVEDEQSHADMIKRYLLAQNTSAEVILAYSLQQCVKEIEAC